MKNLGLTYYVGLLTAASLHGATLLEPRLFQTVLAASRCDIYFGHARVQFVGRNNVEQIPTVKMNTSHGAVRVSTPEATAFDLVRFSSRAGGLSNVASVLIKLTPLMDATKLIAEIERSPLSWAQRLGYLLELIGAEELAEPLAVHVSSLRRVGYAPLQIGKPASNVPRDTVWKLFLNEEVTVDL